MICIPPRPGLPLAYVNGVPNALHVTAWWYDQTIPAHVAESFTLYKRAVPTSWSGQSGQVGLNLYVQVDALLAANTYDISLAIRRDLIPLDDDSWHGVIIPQGPPFNSGLLQHVYTPGLDANGIRVLD